MATPNYTRKPAHTAPQAKNLWLAIGDETGRFEEADTNDFHGVGLILARPHHLQAALDELIDGKTVRTRMGRAIEGLETYLRSGALESGAKELGQHHVLAAWKYFEDRRFQGTHALGDTPDDPVLRNLLAAFRWLAGHQNIISTGTGGRGRELFGTFSTSSDPAAALGMLYGRTLAILRPFLGKGAQIRFLPGRRSELLRSEPLKRSGQLVSNPQQDNRASSSSTGGNRVLLSSANEAFWELQTSMSRHWPVPESQEARRNTFLACTEEDYLLGALEREDSVATALIRNNKEALHHLADLACSLMSVSRSQRQNGLRIELPSPIGPNVRFFDLSEVSQ